MVDVAADVVCGVGLDVAGVGHVTGAGVVTVVIGGHVTGACVVTVVTVGHLTGVGVRAGVTLGHVTVGHVHGAFAGTKKFNTALSMSGQGAILRRPHSKTQPCTLGKLK